MKRAFSKMLLCPSCGADFGLKAFVEDERGIEEGLLRCGGCGRLAPIIRGVPRILPVYINPFLWKKHPEFFERHDVRIPLDPPRNGFERLNRRIFEAFSYNWDAAPSFLSRRSRPARRADGGAPRGPWHAEDARIFRDNVAGLTPDFFPGKLGLDAGCNVGRHLKAARESGAEEMIGLDQTFAIDRARELLGADSGIHLVQGSIFEFPLRPGLVDFAMCFGVVHHTPDPAAAFRVVAAAVKPGGAFLVMVYGLDEMALWYRLSHMRTLRRLTTRLPLPGIRRLCEGLAFGMKYGVVVPLSALASVPGIGATAKRFPFSYFRRDPVLDISRSFFDRLAPPVATHHTRREIEGWFGEAGFRDVRVTRREANAWRGTGTRAS